MKNKWEGRGGEDSGDDSGEGRMTLQ